MYISVHLMCLPRWSGEGRDSPSDCESALGFLTDMTQTHPASRTLQHASEFCVGGLALHGELVRKRHDNFDHWLITSTTGSTMIQSTLILP